MIENELLFLGLLKDGPKHGYEIKRLIDDELTLFVGVKIKSIYYPLRKMEKLGLIKKELGKEGNWPEKYVYGLTAKGKKRFDELISESFLSVERPYFSINLSLYFLQYTDKKMAKRQLEGRLRFLQRIKRFLEDLQQSKPANKPHLGIILDHDMELVDAEITSITRLAKLIN